MRITRNSIYVCMLLTAFSCSKKNNVSPTSKTVLLGNYSLLELYSINSNGTYTVKQPGSCLANFLLDLQANNQFQLQDACLNVNGTWSNANSTLIITESSGQVLINGKVEFETDGITIDVNNMIDNTRYVLWRN